MTAPTADAAADAAGDAVIVPKDFPPLPLLLRELTRQGIGFTLAEAGPGLAITVTDWGPRPGSGRAAPPPKRAG